MRIGILGGSFDPPHIAHTMLCLYVLETRDVDRVYWIPTCAHPLGKDLIAFEHRLRMSRLAVAPLGERVEVLDLEEKLPHPNYTVNTLRHLRNEHPADDLHLIIGSDILAERDQWRAFDEIERLAPPIVITRSGFGQTGDQPAILPDIKSHEIRRRLESGLPVDDCLSLSVQEYIRENNLYRQTT